jgi:putative RNA 2'-phosphotransferase
MGSFVSERETRSPTMNDRERIRLSKFLSRHLRHAPQDIGLTLQEGGWVGVEELLAACAGARVQITREQLNLIVSRCEKQRFSFDDSGTRIRANQGHSVEIDLQLEPATPPAVLYHGTGRKSLPSILEQGLQRMARHHVHLSVTMATARTVGARHGSPVVLVVDAARLAADGHVFYCSENGVWLVDEVPPAYLRVLTPEETTA